MTPSPPDNAGSLIKAVLVLQLKLLLDTARDLLLSPVALVAAGIDLVLLKAQKPMFFNAVLRLGLFSDRWIDLWSESMQEGVPRENVDALLARVEEVVRDPATGARKARILRRWAERQLRQAGRNAISNAGTACDDTTAGPPATPRG